MSLKKSEKMLSLFLLLPINLVLFVRLQVPVKNHLAATCTKTLRTVHQYQRTSIGVYRCNLKTNY